MYWVGVLDLNWSEPIIGECWKDCRLCPSFNFEVTPEDRIAKILRWWKVTEEDVWILSEQWYTTCDIMRMRAVWVLDPTNINTMN